MGQGGTPPAPTGPFTAALELDPTRAGGRVSPWAAAEARSIALVATDRAAEALDVIDKARPLRRPGDRLHTVAFDTLARGPLPPPEGLDDVRRAAAE